MSELIEAVSEEDFQEQVLDSKKPVLIDFYASWCGPCQAFSPVISNFAMEYSDRMAFLTCDVDSQQELARRYGIKSIPTLIFFDQGKPVEVVTGVVPRQKLAEIIADVLAGKSSGQVFPLE